MGLKTGEVMSENEVLLYQERSVLHAGLVPAEWRSRIDRTWWYRVSSFTYCVAGGFTAVRPEPLYYYARSGCPWFPFRTMGVGIALNGLISYMSDVVMWGKQSWWKHADVMLATINTVVQVLIMLLQICGVVSFPTVPATLHAISICVAIYCKRRAVQATTKLDCDGCLKWHAAWHYSLPAGALAAQL